MKTKALFVIMLFLCLGAGAQNKVLITRDVGTGIPGHTWVSQVRHWPGTDFAVTLTGTDSTAGFCIINYNPFSSGIANPLFPLRYVELPAKISSLYDFCVIDNHVFFCADTFIYGVYNEYFVGYFDLNELLYGTLVNYTLLPIDTAASLYKIAGFHDSHGFKLFAAGTTSTSTGNFYAIFEIDNPLTSVGYSFKYFDLQPPYYTERIDEILFGGKFVMFVGRNNNDTPGNRCAISMRRVSKSLGLSDPYFSILRYYMDPIPSNCEYNSSIKAVSLSDEAFAIAYAHYESNFSQRIRLFDFNFNNRNSQEYICAEKYELYDLTFHRLFGTMTITEPCKNESQFTFLRPHLTTPYIAGTMRDLQRIYTSVDSINSGGLISASDDVWLMLKVPIPPADSACVIKGMRNVYIIPNLTMNVATPYINMGAGSINPLLSVKIPFSSIIRFQCHSR